MITLKRFQEDAVSSAVAVFEYMKSVLNDAGAEAQNREIAIHDNGYILIEAPTGAGKTLIAGHIVERVSGNDNIVWFWFAPFKGVVDQSAAFLREQFQGLRLRTLAEDRNPIGTRSGDVFVTTWSSVATRIRDRRSVRVTGEQNESIDDLIVSLREQGYRIGVVVDEAHHTFHGENQAAIFFRTVLKPEYTILVTATPDDKDLEDLKERMQIANIHRISISREDAIGTDKSEGLIKRGIRAIAWRLQEGSEVSVDFERTALQAGAFQHRIIKAELEKAKINLTPLMLVQVDSSAKSIERAKQHLLELNFKESQIAIHTANEPDANLLSLANDESREVLIFKMAVALGFDAPRAWTLVSMRAAKDEDFGVQLVGRLLRVHRRLQGKVVSDILQYGYVMLSNIEAQGGLDAAGQRINRIRTQYASVSPTTVILIDGSTPMVQSSDVGSQLQILPLAPKGSTFVLPPDKVLYARTEGDTSQMMLGDELPELETLESSAVKKTIQQMLSSTMVLKQPEFEYPLRGSVPTVFKTQKLPDDVDVTEEECAAHFVVDAEDLLDSLNNSEHVKVVVRTLDVFTSQIELEYRIAAPDPERISRRAYQALNEGGFFSPKALRKALLERLAPMLQSKGVEDVQDSAQASKWLNVLLAQRPDLLREARKKAMAAKVEVLQAAPLPPTLSSSTPLEKSRLNIYGAYPSQMNTWERNFAEFLDDDDSQIIQWWHRNEPRKPWSINVLMENGEGFYPDFIVGIKARPTENGGLLADTKYAYETAKELPKLLADHAVYGGVLIITINPGNKKWSIAGLDPLTHQPRIIQPFRIMDAAKY